MSTAVDQPIDHEFTEQDRQRQFANQLAEQTVAVRLCKKHLSRTKSLTDEQKERQAAAFRADPEMLGGTKKLFRRNNASLKKVNSVLGAATAYFKASTVEYPEDTVRLLRTDQVEEFEARMNQFLDDLADAVANAEQVYQTEILPEAEERLGDLHNRDDYPPNLNGQWSIDWDYPSVQPDDRLAKLNPELFQQEKERVQKRFEEALHLQEQAFIASLQEVIASLVERLSPQEVAVYRYAGPNVEQLEARIAEIDLEIDRQREVQEDACDLRDQYDEAQQAIEELDAEKEAARMKQRLSRASLIEARGDKWTAEREEGRKVKRDTWTATAGPEYCERHDLEFTRRKQELKTFHASTVEHLGEFFERFRKLNIGSNEQLDQLVEEAKQTVQGLDAAKLKQADQEGRDSLRTPLSKVGEKLEALMVDKPKRKIRLKDE